MLRHFTVQSLLRQGTSHTSDPCGRIGHVLVPHEAQCVPNMEQFAHVRCDWFWDSALKCTKAGNQVSGAGKGKTSQRRQPDCMSTHALQHPCAAQQPLAQITNVTSTSPMDLWLLQQSHQTDCLTRWGLQNDNRVHRITAYKLSADSSPCLPVCFWSWAAISKSSLNQSIGNIHRSCRVRITLAGSNHKNKQIMSGRTRGQGTLWSSVKLTLSRWRLWIVLRNPACNPVSCSHFMATMHASTMLYGAGRSHKQTSTCALHVESGGSCFVASSVCLGMGWQSFTVNIHGPSHILQQPKIGKFKSSRMNTIIYIHYIYYHNNSIIYIYKVIYYSISCLSIVEHCRKTVVTANLDPGVIGCVLLLHELDSRAYPRLCWGQTQCWDQSNSWAMCSWQVSIHI